MDIQFDDEELYQTAMVVCHLNPHLSEDDIENLVGIMKDESVKICDPDLGYISIYGFVLTAYKTPDGIYGIKSSVATHLIERYLPNKQGVTNDRIEVLRGSLLGKG